LTTVRADGQPQTSYVWFHHDGEDIVVLGQPDASKIRNIEAPQGLNLDGDTATGGGVLKLEGAAELLGEMPTDRLSAYVAKYESRIRKGPGGTPDGLIAVFSSAIRIVPARAHA
jgi:PPOX class probable F420-dependent enzyme